MDQENELSNEQNVQDLAFAAYDESMAEYEKSEDETPEAESQELIDQRARDEQGRFAKNEQPLQETPAVTPEAQQLPVEDKPPSSWNAEAKALWSKIPPEFKALKDQAMKREQDFLNGYQQIKPDADYGKQFREFLTPYEPMFQEMGGAGQAIGDMLYTAKVLRYGTAQEKQNAMVEIAKKFNIPLPSQGAESVAPNDEIRALNERLLAFETKEKERELKAQEELKTSYTKAAEKWMTEKDKEGKPLRPYVDAVLNDMQLWVPHIKATNPELTPDKVFQEAYDRAVWANPETRAQLEAARQQQASNQEANLRKVKDAKRAASNNVVKKGSLSSAPGKTSMEEAAYAAYDETMEQYGG